MSRWFAVAAGGIVGGMAQFAGRHMPYNYASIMLLAAGALCVLIGLWTFPTKPRPKENHT